jgi:hypothetical protein
MISVGRSYKAVYQENKGIWLFWGCFREEAGDFIPLTKNDLPSLSYKTPEIDGDTTYDVTPSGKVLIVGKELRTIDELIDTGFDYDPDTGLVFESGL